ncbi:MAG: hypothetical protein RLZZ292_1370 [Bacteroidota bacterium]|jgi:glycosidase
MMRHHFFSSTKITTILLVLFFSIRSFAQTNDDVLQRLPQGITKPVYKHIYPSGGEVKEARIEPLNWWVGMKNPKVQLMIHDKNIKDATVEIKYKGIKVEKVTSVENPNYLFIDLNITPKTKAGKFLIVLKKGDKTLPYAYELKERNTGVKAQGLTPADFVYLIMPDRFANGDASNDSYDDMTQTTVNRKKLYFRHGGDLKGVTNHLDYLKDLGVTAVWLNPAIENNQPYESYHGYAVTDHYNIDKRFGGNTAYKEFADKTHSLGMKVVHDIVFNHVGDQHWWVRDLPETDWVHQFDTLTKPNYRDQIIFDPYASQVDTRKMLDGWFDNHMPDLNQRNPRLAKYLIQNSLWLTEYFGVDAYRIDTWIYPDQDFLRDWAQQIRAEYPNIHLFGEAWVKGNSNQAFFTQNARMRKDWNNFMPSLQDFQVHFAINEAMTQEPSWDGGIMRLYNTLANDFLYENPNLNVTFLDNHDITRYYSTVNEDFNKYKSGLTLLLTVRGIPNIYYGTEILMKGVCNPDGYVREDFSGGWAGDASNKFTDAGRNAKENEAFNYLRRLANYRLKQPALQDGKTMQFIPENGTYVFFRYNDKATVMVATNCTNNPVTVATSRFAERMNGFTKAKNVITEEVYSDLSKLKLDKNSTVVLELMK